MSEPNPDQNKKNLKQHKKLKRHHTTQNFPTQPKTTQAKPRKNNATQPGITKPNRKKI
jgi:hypothetical protein